MDTEDQNQDFTAVSRLLKLKRYEQPPPRYFNDFSGQVIARLRPGRSRRQAEAFDAVVQRTPWLRRLWEALEGRPALSGVLAATFCGLMFAAVFISENTTTNLDTFAVGGGTETANDLAPGSALGGNFAGAPQLVSSTNFGNIRSHFDTIPNLPAGSLFDTPPSITPVPVSRTTPIWQQ